MPEDEIFTKAVHAGEDPKTHHGSLSVPIYQSAVFSFPDAEVGAAIHERDRPGYFYGRMGNPTQAALETAVSQLEGGEAALAFSSGMAAITTALISLLKSGDHIVVPETLYATTDALFTEMLVPLGIRVTHVDPETRLFYLESPANPTLTLQDIESIVAVARAHNVATVMDNTFATPFNQRPLDPEEQW